MTMGGPDHISEQEFVDVWGARAKPSGDLYVHHEVTSLPPEHVWTISEGEELDEDGFNVDGSWYATPGVSIVNAIGYVTPDGHFKFPHLWPVKFPRAGRLDYGLAGLVFAMRAAASLSR